MVVDLKIKKRFFEFDQKWRKSLFEPLDDPVVRRSAERHAWWIDHGVLRSLYTNSFEIAKGVYRSNQPSPARIEYLFSKGVRTIVNLRGASDQGAFLLEKDMCNRLGIKLINHQLAASSLKSKEVLLQLCEIFKRTKTPILMHCKSGSDRAGLAAAIYLIVVNGVDPRIAAKQLSIKYLHLRWYITGVLDYMMSEYVKAFENKGICFEKWLEKEYNRDELLETFFKGRGKWSMKKF